MSNFQRLMSFVACAFLFIPVISRSAEKIADGSPKYLVFLTADGFRTDYVEWFNPPNIKRLIAGGTRVRNATNVFPTLTTPNMTSLVTGSHPRTTGISGNSQYVKELDKIVDRPRDNQAETIAETLQKAGWKTAAVNHFMLEKRGTDFYSATVYQNSAGTTAEILKVLKSQKPQFIAAIYGAPDKAGHRFGPRSEEVKNAVIEVDEAIGILIEGLKEQGIYEQTTIVFSSDHGMSSYDVKPVSAEPDDVLRKAGFRVYSGNGQFPADTQVIVIPLGVRIIYFRNLSDAQKAKARTALTSITGVEILGRKELDALNCHDNRSGDLIVSPLPGYAIGAGKSGGLHGQMAERNPVLFFCGVGIKKGAIVESAQNIDVVPTLLHLVNVKPAATVNGKVIREVLIAPHK